MKAIEEIEEVLSKLPDQTRFPGMSYEDGIREALEWIIGEISDDEFSYF